MKADRMDSIKGYFSRIQYRAVFTSLLVFVLLSGTVGTVYASSFSDNNGVYKAAVDRNGNLRLLFEGGNSRYSNSLRNGETLISFPSLQMYQTLEETFGTMNVSLSDIQSAMSGLQDSMEGLEIANAVRDEKIQSLEALVASQAADITGMLATIAELEDNSGVPADLQAILDGQQAALDAMTASLNNLEQLVAAQASTIDTLMAKISALENSVIVPDPEPEPVVTMDGLVLSLPLYEMNGSVLTTPDAYAHQATVTEALWTPQGYYFDGINDVITVPDNDVLEMTSGLTFEGWVKVNTVENHNSIGGKAAAIWADTAYTLQVWNNGIAAFGASASGGPPNVVMSASSGVYIAGDTWYHIVGTFNRPEAVLYVNGVAAGTGDWDFDIFAGGAADLYIGKYAGNSASLHGSIGEVRIYNRGLTEAEVVENYEATKARYQ